MNSALNYEVATARAEEIRSLERLAADRPRPRFRRARSRQRAERRRVLA
jgi:hypothetical protein